MKKIKKSKLSRRYLILGLILALVAGIYWYVQNILTPPTIALIGDSTQTAPACTSNITSFVAVDGCGTNAFKLIEARCLDGRLLREGGPGACVNSLDTYKRAVEFCGLKCATASDAPISTAIPQPSPSPTPTPVPVSPPPTSDPSPLVSCQTETYRIPKNYPLEKITKETLLSYRVDPTNLVVSPGERLAFNLRLTNIKPYPLVGGMLDLVGRTSVLNGGKEPFKLIAQSPLCVVQQDGNTIACLQRQFELGLYQSSYPDMYFVVDVLTPTTVNEINIMYSGTHSKSSFSCAPVKVRLATSLSTAAPTATAVPIPTATAVPTSTTVSPIPTSIATPALTPTPTRAPLSRFDVRTTLSRYYQYLQCRNSCRRENKANSWSYCANRCR